MAKGVDVRLSCGDEVDGDGKRRELGCSRRIGVGDN